MQPANNTVILGGVDYSGIPGRELYRVIIQQWQTKEDDGAA